MMTMNPSRLVKAVQNHATVQRNMPKCNVFIKFFFTQVVAGFEGFSRHTESEAVDILSYLDLTAKLRFSKY